MATTNRWTAAQNKANITLKDTITWRQADISAYRQEQAEIQKTTNMMATQQNALLRAKNAYDGIVHSIQENVTNEQKAAQYTAQLTAAYEKLQAQLSKPLSSQELAAFNIQFRGTLNEVSRSAGITNNFQQGLSDLGKVATLAAGPLSGIAARLTAFAYLADQMTVKFAALAAGITGMAVAMTASVKVAADFQMGMTRTGAAAGLTGDQYQKLSVNMIQLSKDLMIPTGELLKISQAAAQAGVVGVDNLTAFTKVVAELTRTTSLTAESASDSLLELVNVTKYPIDQIQHLGDVITEVGQSSVGSESKVVSIATEIAKAGYAYGFTAEKAVAWAGALADTGQEAEVSSTALIQSIQKIGKIVQDQGPAFHQLAQFIGMTDEQLKTTFDKDGPRVIQKFVEALGTAKGSFEQMQDLAGAGIVNVRTGRVDSALATNAQAITKHLDEASNAAGALQAKFDLISKTFDRVVEGLKVNFEAIGIVIGTGMLAPLTGIVNVINKITSATGAMATVFSVFGLAVTQVGIMWGSKKGMGLAVGILNDLKASTVAATGAVTSLGAAETVVVAETAAIKEAEIATTATTDIFAVSVAGVSTAFSVLTGVLRAFWPVLAVEAIIYAIDKMDELQKKAADTAQKFRGQGASDYKDQISNAMQQGPDAVNALKQKLLAGRDNAAGKLLKTQGLAGEADAASGGLTNAYDDDINNWTNKVNEFKGALEALNNAQKDTAKTVAQSASATLQVSSKTANQVLADISKEIQKTADGEAQLNILKTKGVEAFKLAQARDAVTERLNPELNKIGGADRSSFMAGALKSFQGVSGIPTAQIKALQDAMASNDWKKGKEAIIDLNTSLAEMQAHAKVAGEEIEKAGNKAGSASASAYKTLSRQLDVLTAGYKNVSKAVGEAASGNMGAFDKMLNSQNAAAGAASWMDKIKTLNAKDFNELVEKANALSAALGGGKIGAKDSAEELAKFMYNVASATDDARRNAELLYRTFKEIQGLDINFNKGISKLNTQTAQIGADPDKAKIAEFQEQSTAGYVSEVEKIQNNIADLQNKMATSMNPLDITADADAISVAYGQLNDLLQNKIPEASKVAGDAMAANLDKHRIVDPLISSMDTLRSSFVQFGTTAITNFHSIGDAFASLLQNMANAILQNQVLGPLSDALFGKKGGAGGGLFGDDISNSIGGSALSFSGGSSLFSSFGGFFASGGPVSPGSSYIVGENGPEVFTPGASGNITNNSDAFGGNGDNGQGGGLIHIVLEASPEFNAKVANVSGKIANNVVISYDKNQLPKRVSQLTNDPKVR
jgi:TP901 family phage tail tape measure protein